MSIPSFTRTDFATDIVEPGVQHTERNKISFGEPDGTRSDRARKIAEPLTAAGFPARSTSGSVTRSG